MTWGCRDWLYLRHAELASATTCRFCRRTENVEFQFLSLRQPYRHEISLFRFDVVIKPPFREYFRANLWTAEHAINPAWRSLLALFSKPLDYGRSVRIF
jgi:hypothetical protein